MKLKARVAKCAGMPYPYASVSIHLTREDESISAYGTPSMAWYALYIASAEDLIAAGEALAAVGRELLHKSDRMYAEQPSPDYEQAAERR